MSKRIAALAAGAAVAINAAFLACSVEPNTAPTVTVQQQYLFTDDAGNLTGADCWWTVWPDGGSVDAGAFVIDDMCPSGASLLESCALMAGADRLRLLVSYDDVKLSAGSGPPPPTVVEMLDGVVADAGASVDAVPGLTPNDYIATLVAPAQPVSEMRLTVGVAAGYGVTLSRTFQVVAPAPVLTVMTCGTGDCVAPDASTPPPVGLVSATVSVPGTQPADVTLQTVIDGAVQSETSVTANQAGIVTVTDACGKPRAVPGVTGTAFLDAPASAVSQAFQVCAQSGGTTRVCKDAGQVPVPDITVALDCGDGTSFTPSTGASCTITKPPCNGVLLGNDAGPTLDLVVTGPMTLVGQAASVATVSAGTTSPPVTAIFAVNTAASQAEAHVQIVLPPTDTWQTVTTVGSAVVTSCF